MKNIAKEIFRAYDIRGIVDSQLSEEAIFAIGQAVAFELRQKGGAKIFIGRDGRLSGERLFKALSQGIQSQGITVVDLGRVPTPLLYFATHYFPIPSGIVITGSHNPKEYNGLKLVMNQTTLYGDQILALYDRIKQNTFSQHNPGGNLLKQEIASIYVADVCRRISVSRPLKIVVDSGNGVTGEIAPRLYEQLGCEVIPLFCEIDGNFPNHHPDPGQPKNLQDLQKVVVEEEADFGFAFDGDGDRLGVVDCEGNIILPDRLLILFARDILKHHPKAHILYDVKCSRQVPVEIEKLQGQPIMSRTGHSLIKAKMRELKALLGGEMSGHLFFNDRWFGFDDALYTGARLLELFAKEKSSVTSKSWFETIPNTINTPELLIPMPDHEKFDCVEKLIRMAKFEDAKFEDANISTLDGLRVDFSDGFGLVRPSNTSAYLVLRFEGDTREALLRIQTLFRDLFLQIMPTIPLPF